MTREHRFTAPGAVLCTMLLLAAKAGCAGASLSDGDLSWTAPPSFPQTLEELEECTFSWCTYHEGTGACAVIARPAPDGTAVVEFEFRDDQERIHRASTRMDAPSSSRLKAEILALCKARNRHREDIARPVLFIDRPDGGRLVIPEDFRARNAPLSEKRFTIHDCPLTLRMFLAELFLKEAGLTTTSNLEGCRKHVPPTLDPFDVRRPAPDESRFDRSAPAIRDLSVNPPGFFLYLALKGGLRFFEGPKRALPESQFRGLWPRSSTPIRLALLANHLRFGTEAQKHRAAGIFGDLIVRKRGADDCCPLTLNDTAWALLFGIEAGAARREPWAYQTAVDLLRRDTDTDDNVRILFQWLPVALLNYDDAHAEAVDRMIRKRLEKEMYYNVAFGIEALAELAAKDSVERIRKARPKLLACFPDSECADQALLRLGDRGALRPLLKRLNDPSNESRRHTLVGIHQALGFVCPREELDSGLPDAPLGDRAAVADWVVVRASRGRPVTPTPYSRLASPRYARWLLEGAEGAKLSRKQILEQLAWQTLPEAVERMIGLLKAGDPAACQAVSNRWSFRFFADVVPVGHAKYTFSPRGTVSGDWNAIRQAAREGTLHYFSVGNIFNRGFHEISALLGEDDD